MSLLTDTQGTPERVLSLIQLLAAHGGHMKRADIVAWLNPLFLKSGSARTAANSGAEQTIGAANSLDLIVSGDGGYALAPAAEPISNTSEFADYVHRRLINAPSDDPDALLARVFAVIVAGSERAGGTGWLHELANRAFADTVNQVLPEREDAGAEGRRFNDSKVAPFWRWMTFTGLAVDLPGERHPYIAERLAIELRAADLPVGAELPIEAVLDVIRSRMPYLDGGALYAEVAGAMSQPPRPRGVSPILSTALRDLQEEGLLTLTTRADAARVLNLSNDTFSKVSSVQVVTLNPEPVDA